jgi:UDP-N-acetylmuramate dehydrogenase
MMTLHLPGHDGIVQTDVDLGPLTTYRFGGSARFYAEVPDVTLLRRLVEAWHSADDMPLLILGRGSNVVVSDSGFPGLVVRLGGSFLAIDVAPDGTVAAGGAASLPRLARETVKRDRGGLEWCVGIPGSVGGAVRMNAGGHGSDTAAWLLDAEILDSRTLVVERRPTSDLDLSYRHSSLVDSDIVIGARYRTVAQPREQGERVLREITKWRREHQPGGTHNAGSVFKNPPGDSAGRIIDSVGLKGFRVGGAAVSTRHANFFVADETATAQDVFDLVGKVREIVAEATSMTLEAEIRFVGSFLPVNRSGGGQG